MTPISSALFARRTALGLKQRPAAAQLGVSQAQYQKWESGENEPGGKYLPAIMAWLELDERTMADLVFNDRLIRGGASASAARLWREQNAPRDD